MLAILSGLLITASFPPLDTDWLIWISVIPLFISIEETSRMTAFKLGLLAGLSHYTSLLYWIINVISTYGGLNIFFSITILLLLCLYLSLFMGIFTLVISHFKHSSIKIFFFAGIWISLEYIRTYIFTGFPWGLLGYTLYNRTSIAQIASATGVYGLSFVIVAINILLFQLIIKHKKIIKNRYFITETILLLIFICSFIIYGSSFLAGYRTQPDINPRANIAIIQGNIDQTVKWDMAFQEETMEKYINLTRGILDIKPDIIVWPETAVPLFFQDNEALTSDLYTLAKESGAHFLFGSPAYKRYKDSVRYYNSAWYISPEGDIRGHYNKNHLVPFGEYVPLHKFLPFVQRLVPAAGDFSKGDSVDPLLLGNISSGILICYEVIFPEIAREQVLKGARLLINITNDAWFGFTSAPHQHLYISVFRAIENRRPLIRSANTGISAIIDSAGQVTMHSGLFTDEAITGRISIGEESLSFYSRFGDIFASGVLILCLLKIFIDLRFSRKKRKV